MHILLDSVETNLNISRQVRDKSESKYQRVQDKSETIEKRLESGLESETELEYYSPNFNVKTTKRKEKNNTLLLTR